MAPAFDRSDLADGEDTGIIGGACQVGENAAAFGDRQAGPPCPFVARAGSGREYYDARVDCGAVAEQDTQNVLTALLDGIGADVEMDRDPELVHHPLQQ